MGVPSAHENAAANSGRFESGPFTRKRAGEWGSITARRRSSSSRYFAHHDCAYPTKNCCSGPNPATPAPAPSAGGTRIRVRLSYIPPAGAFGHAVASIFGADPKSEMDADLMRMKSMIETGNPPHDAARPPLPRES